MRALQTVKLVQDRRSHAVEISQHIRIPEPHHNIAHRFELKTPVCIARDLPIEAVLPAVQFDDEVMFRTQEVDDEVSERRLPFELQAIELAST